MRQPSQNVASEASGANPRSTPAPTATALTATETVTRPDPGIARGVWEAPAWAFWVALVVVVLGGGLYALRRLGILRLSRSSQSKKLQSTR